MGNIYRKDYVTDYIAIIAKGRGKRPTDFSKPKTVNKTITCPFCRGNEKMTPPTIDQIGTPWKVRCFRNKFPATNPKARFKKLVSLFGESPAAGDHEVVVDTAKHGKDIGQLPVSQIKLILEMIARRVHALSKKYTYVVPIHNSGKEAGASLSHLHAQLFALPYVPSKIANEAKGLRIYKRKKKRCAYCEVARKEAKGPRKIFQTKNFVVFAPWAPKFPYETWIMPKNHLKTIHDVNLEELAGVLKKLFAKYEKIIDNMPYNFIIYSAPKGSDYHFNVKVMPRLSTPAGLEFGSGSWVCQIPPEDTAKALWAAKA